MTNLVLPKVRVRVLVLPLTLSLLVVLGLVHGEDVAFDYNKGQECPYYNEICKYQFQVNEKLTMMFDEDERFDTYMVKASKGELYKFDEGPGDDKITNIPIDKIVSADGFNRMAIVVNGMLPGPPIIVYEGQEVEVTVRNTLQSNSVTIHWHGLHMKEDPWMDGVGWISQCPILSGQTFVYKFKVQQKGTYWYHSHVGGQRSDGVFGAFIIKEKPKKNVPTPPVDEIMVIGDWHHDSSEEVYWKMIYGNFDDKVRYVTTNTTDGGMFSNVPWVSALINGKGRYRNPKTGEIIEAPLTQYNVTRGETYRFRVIQAGALYPLRVSVDNHNITVVASDGYDIKPKEVESVIVNPGERFDFLLTANQLVGNYWIRTVSIEENQPTHAAEAILHYNGSRDVEPTTRRKQCTRRSPCIVVNCPFQYFPDRYNEQCIVFNDLENANDNDPAPEMSEKSQEHFLNFAFPGLSYTPGAVNGKQYVMPSAHSLLENDVNIDYSCSRNECSVDNICRCEHQLDLPYDQTIQMVWTNMGRGSGWGHPIHIHGHSFYVVKMVYPAQDPITSKIIEPQNHVDIDCGTDTNNYCNQPTWRNSSWKSGNIPGINLRNPPRKDTLIIPPGGYAVIRLRSNNPGKWFLHCHIEVHSMNGMAMLINEASENYPSKPPNFPECKNFYNVAWKDTFSKGKRINFNRQIFIVIAVLKYFVISSYILI